MDSIGVAQTLVKELDSLAFGPPTTHVYNPLVYAHRPHQEYLERFGTGPRESILLGMNPGPFGMAQTGVPFGDVTMVREWMGIEGVVEKPEVEHPKRPVDGFDCRRSEVSGTRLWSWARDVFGTPERFFARFFVWNYCPLCFMEESGKNRTPDKLPAKEREPLFRICDRALLRIVKYMSPRYVIGVGKFAEDRALAALGDLDVAVARIPHPSPANPVANKGWAKAAEAALAQYGIDAKP